jgi:four helix bundle protein
MRMTLLELLHPSSIEDTPCRAGSSLALPHHASGSGIESANPACMSPDELRTRAFDFAVAVYAFARPMLQSAASRHPAQQLIRAACSVAANYRAACLARTRAEWLAKIGVVREEADETLFWLELIVRVGATADAEAAATASALTKEADELARIFATTGQERKQAAK